MAHARAFLHTNAVKDYDPSQMQEMYPDGRVGARMGELELTPRLRKFDLDVKELTLINKGWTAHIFCIVPCTLDMHFTHGHDSKKKKNNNNNSNKQQQKQTTTNNKQQQTAATTTNNNKQ